MKVRRFRASSYADALRQVKETLGAEAVILESRKIRSGLTSAQGDKADARSRWQWRWLGLGGSEGPSEPAGAVVAVELTAAVGDGAESLVAAPTPLPTPSASAPKTPAAEAPTQPRSHALRQLEAQLLNEEVDGNLATEIAESILSQLSPDQLEDDDRILDLAVADLFARIETLPLRDGDEGPNIQVLVGPAGVGKTTTIAKLAAAGSLRRDEAIAIISLGPKETATRPELARVAKVLQAPYHVCQDADMLMEALAPLGECDRILVDTPSASPFDYEAIDRLGHMLSAMPSREVHLVLSPALRDRDLRANVEGYAPLGLGALIFTHLDEAASYGGILNACSGAALPLSWLCYGPRVPSDIELASAERLIDLLLDISGRLNEDDVVLPEPS